MGTTVGIVAGASVNDDGGTVLNFAITNQAAANFAINPMTGVITVAGGAHLDYETAPFQTITVRTTDATGVVADQNFTIASEQRQRGADRCDAVE